MGEKVFVMGGYRKRGLNWRGWRIDVVKDLVWGN
jgi:hypothetical protein